LSNGRFLKPFGSQLFLVAMSIIYGVLFMILLALNYEHHLHHPNDPQLPDSNTPEISRWDSALSSASALVISG
jgi:hypothetical protein